MAAFRWDQKALDSFNERMATFRKTGTTRTHHCLDEAEAKKLQIPQLGKYGNKPTEVGGEKFASKKEAKRWLALQCIEAAGTISGLDRQVRFSLDINGVHICDYVADFVYRDAKGVVVEDSKGYRTDVYKLKKLLMLAILNIEVVET